MTKLIDKWLWLALMCSAIGFVIMLIATLIHNAVVLSIAALFSLGSIALFLVHLHKYKGHQDD